MSGNSTSSVGGGLNLGGSLGSGLGGNLFNSGTGLGTGSGDSFSSNGSGTGNGGMFGGGASPFGNGYNAQDSIMNALTNATNGPIDDFMNNSSAAMNALQSDMNAYNTYQSEMKMHEEYAAANERIQKELEELERQREEGTISHEDYTKRLNELASESETWNKTIQEYTEKTATQLAENLEIQKAELARKLANGEITQEEYDKQIAMLDAKFEQQLASLATDEMDAALLKQMYINNETYAWDPRLARADAFLMENDISNAVVVPFGSDTASSAFYDFVFKVEAGLVNGMTEQSIITSVAEGMASQGVDNFSGANEEISPLVNEIQSQTKVDAVDEYAEDKAKGRNRRAVDVASYEKNANYYGSQSLINPYSITRLMGAFDRVLVGGNHSMVEATRLYDIRDQRRFYDLSVSEGNPLDVTTPTTSNIIKWSNEDKWGRTPYSYQDFVFCRWWNIIPNNRMLTLRKYSAPTYDNLNFDGMENSKGEAQKKVFSPICTVVTYMGEETGNTLSELLKFSTGTVWEDLESKIHDVSGDEGSNPQTVIDNIFANGGGFGTSGNGLVNKVLQLAGIGVQKLQSFGSFMAMGTGTYDANAENATHLSSAQMDPYSDGPYANRIQGPINRIDSVKKRKEGILWEHEMTIKAEYIARPIGGVNSKAALLDIMSNCLEMASQEAVFWGGGHRFNITQQNYPWKSKNKQFKAIRGIMQDLYEGRIFGANGAIAHTVEGIKEVGMVNGEFRWDMVTSKMKNVFGTAFAALGSAINSLTETILGKSFDFVNDAVNKVTGGDQAQKDAGAQFVETMKKNANNMFRSKVIQSTTYPTLNGMRSLLIGLPVGNWHLTIGNPLNPIAVIGNLVCDKISVNLEDEMGPDDFPLGLTVEYHLMHGMPRDKAAIQSMFNRGAGKIYNLPDWIKASSDYETKVDAYTGGDTHFRAPSFASTAKIMNQTGAHGLKRYKVPQGTTNKMAGNSNTTIVTKFVPVDYEDITSQQISNDYKFLTSSTISQFRASNQHRKHLG